MIATPTQYVFRDRLIGYESNFSTQVLLTNQNFTTFELSNFECRGADPAGSCLKEAFFLYEESIDFRAGMETKIN